MLMAKYGPLIHGKGLVNVIPNGLLESCADWISSDEYAFCDALAITCWAMVDADSDVAGPWTISIHTPYTRSTLPVMLVMVTKGLHVDTVCWLFTTMTVSSWD